MPNYQNCPPLNLPYSNRDYTFARNNNGGSATGHDSARFLKILSQASAFLLWPMAGALRMGWSLSRQRQVDPRSPQSFVAGHPTSNNRDPFTYINHVQNWPPVVSLPSWPVCPAELCKSWNAPRGLGLLRVPRKPGGCHIGKRSGHVAAIAVWRSGNLITLFADDDETLTPCEFRRGTGERHRGHAQQQGINQRGERRWY